MADSAEGRAPPAPGAAASPEPEAERSPRAESVATTIARLTGAQFFSPPGEATAIAPLLNTIIAVEGIICAGKSTLLRRLASHIRGTGLACNVLFEAPNPELLKLFYADMARYAFTLQMDMLRLRQAVNREALVLAGRGPSSGANGGVVWTDRSLWGDATFACVNRARGNITHDEFAVYQSALRQEGPYWYDFVVFLDVGVPRALALCASRGGSETSGGQLEGYFEHLRRAYYIQLREQGRLGLARVVFVPNDPFASVEEVLRRLLRAPPIDWVREVFAAAPGLDDNATPEQVTQAFSFVRSQYDRHYSRA